MEYLFNPDTHFLRPPTSWIFLNYALVSVHVELSRTMSLPFINKMMMFFYKTKLAPEEDTLRCRNVDHAVNKKWVFKGINHSYDVFFSRLLHADRHYKTESQNTNDISCQEKWVSRFPETIETGSVPHSVTQYQIWDKVMILTNIFFYNWSLQEGQGNCVMWPWPANLGWIGTLDRCPWHPHDIKCGLVLHIISFRAGLSYWCRVLHVESLANTPCHCMWAWRTSVMQALSKKTTSDQFHRWFPFVGLIVFKVNNSAIIAVFLFISFYILSHFFFGFMIHIIKNVTYTNKRESKVRNQFKTLYIWP